MGGVGTKNVTAAIMGDPGHESVVVRRLHPGATPAMAAGRLAATGARHVAAPVAEVADAPPPDPPEVAADPAPTHRAVAPLDFDTPLELQPVPTDSPMLEWVAPTELLVAEAYQRDLSERGRQLIRKIAERFDWRRFKPPIVAWTDNGYEVVDGQHTALGAALRPDIPKIPVLVVLAPEIEDRATAFVGHNTDRLSVTTLQVHRARLVAREPEALVVDQVCTQAGVDIVYKPYGTYAWKVGDCMAISAIYRLVKDHGADAAVDFLKVLVSAKQAPISADQMKAVAYLLTEPTYRDRLNPMPTGGADLAATIQKAGDGVLQEAKLMNRTEKNTPVWKALALIWFGRVKARRGA